MLYNNSIKSRMQNYKKNTTRQKKFQQHTPPTMEALLSGLSSVVVRLMYALKADIKRPTTRQQADIRRSCHLKVSMMKFFGNIALKMGQKTTFGIDAAGTGNKKFIQPYRLSHNILPIILGIYVKKNFASFKKGCNFAPAFQEKVIGFKGYQTVR